MPLDRRITTYFEDNAYLIAAGRNIVNVILVDFQAIDTFGEISGVLLASGVYMVLSGHMLRFLVGLLLLSNAINLAIFGAGRLTAGAPPFLNGDGHAPDHVLANALPQALMLTAIVIGLGLFAFALAPAIRAFCSFGHLDMHWIRLAEPERDDG